MSSTYSTNLAIELIGTGDQAGSWGNTTNTNLGTLIEQAISGYVTQAVSTGTDTTITIPNGATGVARNMYIELTGTGGTNTNLIVPANKKLYFIFNNSTGAVTVKVSGQTGVSVPTGKKMVLVSNGTDVVVAENYIADFGSNSATITQLTATSATITNLTLTSLVISNLSIASANITTLTGSTQTLSGNLTLNGGTANGVLYLNGSKVATSGTDLVFNATGLGIGTSSPGQKLHVVAAAGYNSTFQESGANKTRFQLYIDTNEVALVSGYDTTAKPMTFFTGGSERLRIDTSGNLGLGVTPSAWDTSVKVIEFPSSSLAVYNGGITHNAFFDSVNSRWEYRNSSSSPATFLNMQGGAFAFNIAGNGTQNNPISFTQAMTLDASGNLLLGATSGGSERLRVDSGSTGIMAVFNSSNANGGYITLNSSGTAYADIGTAAQCFSGGSAANFALNARGANALVFGTNQTERARITSGGDLLVGTTSGSERIYAATSSGNCYVSSNRASKSTGQVAFRLGGGTSGTDWIIYQDTNSNTLKFFGDSNDRMALDTSGNLGVGTTSPTQKLEVVGGIASTGTDAFFAQRALVPSGVDVGAPALAWRFYTTGTTYTTGAMIQGLSAAAWSSTSAPMNMVFYTVPSGSTTLAERARITSGGDFCVNTTAKVYEGLISVSFDGNGGSGDQGIALIDTNASLNGDYLLFVNSAGNVAGKITHNGTTTVAYTTSSDYRLKENITPSPDAGEKIDAIQIISHDWKSVSNEHVEYGVIAQDLHAIAPQAVIAGDDKEEIERVWGVDYSKLVPMLVKEIQSLRARVTALESA
jgi:hypothetical protein